MSSKIKVDTIENVAGSGNVSLGSGHNLVVPGNIIVRQRGTKIFPGQNVGMGKDHSIFSVIKGKVIFKKSKSDRTYVSVKPN